MVIDQIYTGCLAQGAYYIESEGEAAIIDPLREIKPYLDRASKSNAKIKYIFETHFHADFVSGHIDLSKETGAPIVYGPSASPSFDAIIAEDGQIFKIGLLTIEVIHTPGHTLESVCYLLKDPDGKATCLFSGDTLFLGDVGRPDLAQKSGHLSEVDLAGMLYDSLMQKIMPLDDDIIVYPAHGAGSACGKNMMSITFDKLGNQKRINYALNQPNKDRFVEEVLAGLDEPPAYFGMNVLMNKTGYDTLEDILSKGLTGLTPDEFEAVANTTGATILDVRKAEEFTEGFIPQSINIGLDGQFAPWVGSLLGDVKTPLLIVAEPGREEEVAIRLSRVGFDNQFGYLKGGFASWLASAKDVDTVDRIDAGTFLAELVSNQAPVFDVRKNSEFSAGHMDQAGNYPLDEINTWMEKARTSDNFYIHCAGGYRSMIAASILKKRGIHHFKEVSGGYKSINSLLSDQMSL